MPLLEAPGSRGTLNSDVIRGSSHPLSFSADIESRSDDPNRRQLIVVVGLGMVAISFMYVIGMNRRPGLHAGTSQAN
jgi:nitrite reductase (NAD(P)H)